MLDLFAQVFTVMEVRNFQDIISVRMQTLFDHMAQNQAMLTIPQHFLANANISKHFAEILLNFLVRIVYWWTTQQRSIMQQYMPIQD